ncbi:class I SAM-dependent methyltransferase [Nocardiopsis sp. RSe5-2]|uniref:Class I SAM-dependent methyltransferase n=1 Tax=Nocardiopsis endophytica TaxID=3018445 RepID=A0ABT4U1V8_9ACTN|nr:class I SAM-dependent methyltransferase [Nocardiopsis endophytica]MDA2810924.1 class I SAM-dependent methyltransferase [Nocardiopsis endophytica]
MERHDPPLPPDPKDVVRHGYNAVSMLYRRADEDHVYADWIADLDARLPRRATVLDLGCGCGVPVARALDRAGHAVTGVDISDVQIDRARSLVPGAYFIRADAARVAFPDRGFDAVVCLYSLIHMPLRDQRRLLLRIARWLRPGGRLLATVGQQAWTGTEDGWLGGPAPMWWSHADSDTYAEWIAEAGLTVTDRRIVPEGESAHALFWARSPLGDGFV